MKEVILSADSEYCIYLVPDKVADHLREYCMEFCSEWLYKAPEAKKYHFGEGVCFDEKDFIDYLNEFIFPNQKSTFVRNIGFEIPKEYQHLPYFNF